MKSFATLLFLIFNVSVVQARELKCSTVYRFEKLINLQKTVDYFSGKDLEVFRNQVRGRWIEIREHLWVRYEVFGVKGPIRVHFEGLGGQLETSMKSKILKDHAKNGRVLVIELEGQGAREVHQRLQLIQEGRSPTRQIEYSENIKHLQEALLRIFETENISPNDVLAWGGHSFGGPTLSGLGRDWNDYFSPPLMQFFATGVANFNHRLLTSISKIQANLVGGLFTLVSPVDPATGIRLAADQFTGDPLFSKFSNDPVKMESAVALTMGAGKVDAVKDPSEYPEGTRAQIFTGLKDDVVFSMLHWELAKATRAANVPTSLIMVENVGHYLPMEMSAAQLRSFQKLTDRPEEYDGYYYLLKSGELKPLNEPEALDLYKATSFRTWEVQKPFLEEVFGQMGKIPTYPYSWQ